ncbi:hypothetical protein [Chitinophaga cymbidii]|uniref:Uncharacterized protein n=1 Tax=Chitinophaga cymbidii TaxID=1096750 RepID=A0A512RIC8_9BACT|nr:hypothetical protein [Chitinophaga cymbidii]GEP95447.1 hypothetical protein CCY01nite_17070 [Chitinophaga cymbidii]
MKKLLFLLMLVTVAATAAVAKNGGNENNGDKPDKGAKARSASANASRLEEFIWTLPQAAKVQKVDECEMQEAMVDLYKWYLQNETRINNSPVIQGDDQDAVVAPFKVDPKVLQQYLKFIKKNFPGLNEDDLSDRSASTSAKKKNAPVSYRDDLDAPISVTASPR